MLTAVPRMRRITAIAVMLAATAAIAVTALVLTTGSARVQSHPADTDVADMPPPNFTAPHPIPNGLAVSSASAADSVVPFQVVLPSDATPTAIWATDPTIIPANGRSIVAQFKTPGTGVYQIDERPAGSWSLSTLDWWAQNCQTCTTQKVVTIQGIHVLVMATPGQSLTVEWIRGDGTTPVLTSIAGPFDTFTETAALDIAGSLISKNG